MRRLLLIFLLSTFLSPILAHEFWLNPDKYIYKRTEPINIRFLVGENFEGRNWKGNNARIQSLKIYYGGVSDDLSPYLGYAAGDSLQLTMVDDGTCLIAFNTKNSFIELEPPKFNAYLLYEGLKNAVEYRNDHNETDSSGREYYQRCAKALIQVGDVKDRTFSIATGMPVDIIPLANPYQLSDNDSLTVRILFQKQPLANSLVRVWNRDNGITDQKDMMTDENGEIVFPVSTNGKWMVSAITMEKISDDSKAQWQSYWGTFTWGYE